MQTYREWILDQLCSEEADMSRIMGPSSALGSGTKRADPSVMTKLRTILPSIVKEYPDPNEALEAIMTASMVLLGGLGTTFNPKQARMGLTHGEEGDEETSARELPGEDEDL